MDIGEFIEARLAEEETRAGAATPGPWEFEGDDPTDDELYTIHDGEHGDLVGEIVAFTRGRQVPNGKHMAHWDPGRTVREIAAKRRLLELADDAYHAADHYVYHCIRATLAAIDSDHPDYDPAWTPAPKEKTG